MASVLRSYLTIIFAAEYDGDMNQSVLIRHITYIILATLVILLIGYGVREQMNVVLLADEASVGWFWGVFGTLYALVTAFVMVAVWEQYNGLEEAIGNEAKNLSSLWNYTDYLNDIGISQKMSAALIRYIDVTKHAEFPALANGQRVAHPSPEIIEIMQVIDGVTFDDDRDSVAFSALTSAYDELATSRSTRLEHSVTRIPPLLRAFFAVVSLVFVLGYIIHGYNSALLYYSTLGALGITVSFAYLLIADMDNPFRGAWNISFDAFDNAATYISERSHKG